MRETQRDQTRRLRAVYRAQQTPARALSACVPLLQAISPDGAMFGNPQDPQVHEDGQSRSDARLGQALAKTPGDGPDCLIPQHRIVTVGHDAATAVMCGVLLDRAHEIQLMAMAARPVRTSSSAEEVEQASGRSPISRA